MPQIHFSLTTQHKYASTEVMDEGWKRVHMLKFMRIRTSITRGHPGIILNPGRIDRWFRP